MNIYAYKIALLAVLLMTSSGKKTEEKQEETKDQKPEVGNVIGIDLGTTYSWYGSPLNTNKVFSLCRLGKFTHS